MAMSSPVTGVEAGSRSDPVGAAIRGAIESADIRAEHDEIGIRLADRD